MLMKAFSVFDTKSKTFGNPFFHPQVGLALRMMGEVVNSTVSPSVFSKYPKDFILYEVGVFDDESAGLTPHKTVVLVNHLNDLVVPTEVKS